MPAITPPATSLRAREDDDRTLGAWPASESDRLIGRRAGRYILRELLARGGMSDVYLAAHEELAGARAAVKVLRPELAASPLIAAKFRIEACAITAIDHPRVVKVLDVGRFETGERWIMMELLVGADVQARVEAGGPLPLLQALSFVAQACDGLEAAHRRGIVHCDLKPEHLFVLDPGDDVKILDFGVARVDEVVLAEGTHRRPRTVAGSLGFMAPEQALGATIDRRADVFAMGAIAYWMLTATTPWDGATLADYARASITSRAPDVRDLRPDAPSPWAIAIARALATDPAHRPVTAHEFARCLLDLPGADEVVGRVAPAILLEAREATTARQKPITAQ